MASAAISTIAPFAHSKSNNIVNSKPLSELSNEFEALSMLLSGFNAVLNTPRFHSTRIASEIEDMSNDIGFKLQAVIDAAHGTIALTEKDKMLKMSILLKSALDNGDSAFEAAALAMSIAATQH